MAVDQVPDILRMIHSPHRHLRAGVQYPFYIQSLNMVTQGSIIAVRAITNAYVQLAIELDGGDVRGYLNVPIHENSPLFPIPQPLADLTRSLPAWHITNPSDWPIISHDSSHLQCESRSSRVSFTASDYLHVRVQSQAVSFQGAGASTWSVLYAPRKLRVSQLVALFDKDKSFTGEPTVFGKICGVCAVEKDWVEVLIQIHPSNQQEHQCGFVHLFVPLSFTVLPENTLQAYHRAKHMLVDVLGSVIPAPMGL